MRKSELHPLLQKIAVGVPGKSGVFAVVPQPVKNKVEAPELNYLFIQARQSIAQLEVKLADCNYSELLFRLLNRREAVDSSQIEGTRTGFDELLLYEATIGTTDAIEDTDASITLAYVHAFQSAYEQVTTHGKAALTITLIKQIHQHLISGQDQYKPGNFRTVQNYIGLTIEEARFVPPPADVVNDLMLNLEAELLRDDETVMNTSMLMLAPIVHAQFEAIHPFLDGNGRTGRMLIPLMLLAAGEPPLHLATFLKMRQQEYYDALLQVQMKLNWTDWIRLFLECVAASANHTRQLITHIDLLQEQWEDRLKLFWSIQTPPKKAARADAAIYRVLKIIPGHPVLSVKEVCRLLDISFPAANKAIEELEAVGVLRKTKEQNRNRIYQAHEILNSMFTGMDEVLQQAQNPTFG